MHYEVRHCTHCGTALQPITLAEDGGDKERLRCPACGWTHWNNPTPVLAAIVEVDGKVLLARNAAWPAKMFALITGFMEAGESPQDGVAREVKEETNLDVQACTLVGKHLCTSAEWLAAAVGTPENGGIDGDGNPPGVVACNTRSDGRRHVGALAADADQGAAGESLAGACVSRYGALEMLGNVDEWVADRWLSEGLVHGGHYLAPVSLTSYQTRELDSTASGARCCASGH